MPCWALCRPTRLLGTLRGRTRAQRSTIDRWSTYAAGSSLTFHCDRASDTLVGEWKRNATDINEVRQAFQAWFKLGIGVSFREVGRPDEAAIRIGFDPAGGTWSQVGRDSLLIRDPPQRTIPRHAASSGLRSIFSTSPTCTSSA